MNVKQRIMAARLADRIQKRSEYAEMLGILVVSHISECDEKKNKRVLEDRRLWVEAKGV